MQEVMTYLNNGLAVLAIIAIGFGTWRSTEWIGTNLLIPLRDGFLGHLTKTNTLLEENTSHLGKTSECVDQLKTTLKEMGDDLQELKPRVEEVHKHITTQLPTICKAKQ